MALCESLMVLPNRTNQHTILTRSQSASNQQQLALQCTCLYALLAAVKHLQLIAAMKNLNCLLQ